MVFRIFNFKQFLILVLILFCLNQVFSYTEVSSCQEINSSYGFDGTREVRLNQSVLDATSTCFLFKTANFTFDCQDNWIVGDGGGGDNGILVYGAGNDNITIRNCNIANFGVNLFTFQSQFNLLIYNLNLVNSTSGVNGGLKTDSSNSTFYNINVSNDSNGGLIINGGLRNIFSNIIISNSQYGIYQTGGDYHSFENIEISNSPYGLYVYGAADYNNYTNLYIHNITSYGLRFADSIDNNIVRDSTFLYNKRNVWINKNTITPNSNIFYNNYFGNATTASIGTNDPWANSNTQFTYSGYGNFYEEFDSTGCILTPISSGSCNYEVCSNNNYTISGFYSMNVSLPIVTFSGTCPFILSSLQSETQSESSLSSVFPASSNLSYILIFIMVLISLF